MKALIPLFILSLVIFSPVASSDNSPPSVEAQPQPVVPESNKSLPGPGSAITPAEPGEGQIYPDPVRTPGATYPGVTQDNINDTICSHGKWRTKDIRPPVSYTNKLKRKQIEEYGYTDKDMRHYEEDHLIPLTIGGNPVDPKNLWPESRLTQPLNAAHKDQVENFLNKQVCAGKMTLDDAQKSIATDWVKIYQDMVKSGYIDPWAKRLRREP